MILDYKKRPDISDFSYYLVWNNSRPYAKQFRDSIINPALNQVKKEYAIVFKELPCGEVPHDDNLTYVLYGPTNPANLSKEEMTYLKRLVKLSEAKVNIISVYKTGEIENPEIPRISSEIGCNVIYADFVIDDLDIRTVDTEDIRDNIVCETIRVKYEPRVDTSISIEELAVLQNQHTAEIEGTRNIFAGYMLWHRDTTDGAVVIVTDKGVFVTQTRTDKTKMQPGNFSLVTKFHPDQNEISYRGNKIPSSDTPEFLVSLDRLDPKPRYLIHFHKNEIIRSPAFEAYLTSQKIEYGKFESGQKIFQELDKTLNNSLLLREHGIVWWGNRLDDFVEYLEETLMLKKD